MTSLDVPVVPIGDKSSSVAGGADNHSFACDKSSVGRFGGDDHSLVKNHTSVGAGCSCDDLVIDVPSVLPAGSLDDIPGETVSE